MRIESRGAFAAHPGGEPFVEPEIVPPGHRDQIAKPLVRGLVRDHFVNDLLCAGGGFRRIKQQRRLEIGDATPVLHRAAESAGDGDLVELW